MSKKLSEMTLEELWQLFPIILTDHSEHWAEWFLDEDRLLKSLLTGSIMRISHIGSTAVGGIMAKPIVDILIEVHAADALHRCADILESAGYITMSRESTRISLNKGYTESGFSERVFHIHLRIYGDNDELYFRDYLIAHPDVASAYERLKISLWKKFEHNRDAYTEMKTDFIDKYTKLAKLEFAGRYL